MARCQAVRAREYSADPAGAEASLAAIGVSWIVTDRPDVLPREGTVEVRDHLGRTTFLRRIAGAPPTVPWAYAAFCFAGDLVRMRLAGTDGGGVAYAAHAGGFLFGAVAAGVVRLTDLERRIAPAGAVRWQGSLPLQRAAEALARGDRARARALYAEAVERTPDDEDALLGLARLELEAHDAEAARPRLERVLARRLGAGDTAGARALLDEAGSSLRPSDLRPPTAYRAAEALEATDRERAVALLEAAAAAGGALGAKALVRAAGLVSAHDPGRALALAGRALALEGVPPELAARARDLAATLRPPPVAAPGPAAASTGAAGLAPVRVVSCDLADRTEAGLMISTGGRARTLPPARVAAVAVGVVGSLPEGAGMRRNAVVVDLVLRPRPGEGPVVLRIAAHRMALGRLHPGAPPAASFAAVVEGLLRESGAAAVPDAAAAAGRPFARFPDLAAFERACHGGPLAAVGSTAA